VRGDAGGGAGVFAVHQWIGSRTFAVVGRAGGEAVGVESVFTGRGECMSDVWRLGGVGRCGMGFSLDCGLYWKSCGLGLFVGGVYLLVRGAVTGRG